MFGTKNNVVKLQQKSDNILNVFTQTVQDLTLVNHDVEEELKAREEEIRRIQAEQDQLTIVKSSNEKMITKINTFINE
jgi:hypothetical protein